MRQVWLTRVGPPETLLLKEAPDPLPHCGEVRIRVHASGINFADIMARVGLYPDAPRLPAVLGYEVSGVVDALGQGASRFHIGDKVLALTRFGGYSDLVCVPQNQVYPLPEGFTFAQGAALPVNYLTAYQMLFAMGSLKAGETVLVHSAGGGVGLAVLELCKIAGAQVIGIASRAKHERLRAMGVALAIDSGEQDFEVAVRDYTKGHGVHIVLDPVGGNSWAKGLRCLAPTGRLVLFGFSGAATGKSRNPLTALWQLARVPWLKLNPLTLISENKAVVGVNLGHLWRCPQMVEGWSQQLLTWCRQGKIQPTVDRQFPLQEAATAHHYIQDRKNFGKVVLVP